MTEASPFAGDCKRPKPGEAAHPAALFR